MPFRCYFGDEFQQEMAEYIPRYQRNLPVEFRATERRVWVLAGFDLDYPRHMFDADDAERGVSYRLLISRVPSPTQLYDLGGWEVRRLPFDPDWRILIVDDTAQLTRMEGEEVKGFGFADTKEELVEFERYFEELWETAEPYLELRTIPNLVKTGADVKGALHLTTQDWYSWLKAVGNGIIPLSDLSPRRFEELVAELLAAEGMSVMLTPESSDGGADILAWSSTSAGRQLFVVECKHRCESQKIGVETVRSLFGVVEAERASKGILVTSSTFTRGAREFEQRMRYRIELRDMRHLLEWIRSTVADGESPGSWRSGL